MDENGIGQVIDLASFRKCKDEQSPIPPLFSERIGRIRASLVKINKLMAELRAISNINASERAVLDEQESVSIRDNLRDS